MDPTCYDYIYMENNTIESSKVESAFSSLHQVTPLSKYLALILFIILPFLGGYIGYVYAPVKIIEVENVAPESAQYLKNEQQDTIDTSIIDFISEAGSENIIIPKPGEAVGAFTVLSSSIDSVVTIGTTTVSGNLNIMDGILAGETCFDVTPADAWKIPRVGDDIRSPWFCFRNVVPTSAIQGEGIITIEIANYEVDSRATETSDTAEFVRLVE